MIDKIPVECKTDLFSAITRVLTVTNFLKQYTNQINSPKFFTL